MSDKKNPHMTPEEFRRYGRAVVDWIADYYENIESFPVLSQVQPGQIRASLPPQPPLQGEDFEVILSDVNQLILPGVTHWQSPNFFAFFPANTSGPSILGELLSAGLGVQGMLWATSPACTELETHVLDWLVDMLDLPAKFKSSETGGGVIQDSASSASLCALLAARERATGLASNERGCDGRLVAYASTQAHSSIEKAIKIAGLGRQNLRLIEVDERFAFRPDGLARQIQLDRQAGLLPCFVCATVGTTSSNAIDPLPEIGQICQQEGLWLHVDAAMAGTATICPEYRHIHAGLELADSYCFNPHKWMFTNFDCDCFYVADRAALINALSVLPEYLRNKATESGAVIDYRDWQISLGRRFRSLKLWFVIRYYGVEGLRHHIRHHVELAQNFAKWVEDDERFELVVPPPLNLVCFRHVGGEAVNEQLLDRLNQSGDLYLTHTKLNDRYTLRFCVGQTNTQASHVQRAWQQIQEVAAEIEKTSLPIQEKINILKTVNIFERTPDHVLDEIAPLMEEEKVAAGGIIFEKGELGDSLYIIVDGRIHIHDEERTLNYLEKGDVFGEMALLDPKPRLASAEAEKDTHLLSLDAEHFRSLLVERGEVALGIIQVLTGHLRARVHDLAQARTHAESLERTWVEQRMSSLL